MTTPIPTTTPTASSFDALAKAHAPAIVRQLYLGQLDSGHNWDQLLVISSLAWRRREMIRFLFIEIKLSDEQIAWLFETLSRKIRYFRMNNGILKQKAATESKHSRPPASPPAPNMLGLGEVARFFRRWKLIFSDNFDRDDTDRPYHRLSIAAQRRISRLAKLMVQEHNAHI